MPLTLTHQINPNSAEINFSFMDDTIYEDEEVSLIQFYHDEIIKFDEFDDLLKFIRYKYALSHARMTLDFANTEIPLSFR